MIFSVTNTISLFAAATAGAKDTIQATVDIEKVLFLLGKNCLILNKMIV